MQMSKAGAWGGPLHLQSSRDSAPASSLEDPQGGLPGWDTAPPPGKKLAKGDAKDWAPWLFCLKEDDWFDVREFKMPLNSEGTSV